MQENYRGAFILVAVLAAVLLIGALRRKKEWILNFVLRSVLGTIAIYYLNLLSIQYNVGMEVGINLTTVLTTGILGIPGVIGLYGINLLYIL